MSPFVTQGLQWVSQVPVKLHKVKSHWVWKAQFQLPHYFDIRAQFPLLGKLPLMISLLSFRGMLINSRQSWFLSQTQHQRGPRLILGKNIESVPKVVNFVHFRTVYLLNPVFNTILSWSSEAQVGSSTQSSPLSCGPHSMNQAPSTDSCQNM